MVEGKKIVVCLPAYNAAKTLQHTYNDIPKGIVDTIILVDDASSDETVTIAHSLNIDCVITHSKNRGYGANQKSCYKKALEIGGDIIVMLHPDYQYNPKIIPSMVYLIANDIYPIVLGSRILGKSAMRNGMPAYKYISNRILTLFQNIVLNRKLSEYHTGYRAYKSEVLSNINFLCNSDDFIFDNQLLVQVMYKGYEVGEISCPAKYFPEASSINFSRSLTYGIGVVVTSLQYRLNKLGLAKFDLFK